LATTDGRFAHLISIAVLREHRRKGVAGALLQRLVKYLECHGVDELWLEVNIGNKEAIDLYEKFGFLRMMILENYYSDGAPALRMRLGLNKEV
jgi:ribosomal-protein-alanine N-acetyltransferase